MAEVMEEISPWMIEYGMKLKKIIRDYGYSA